MKCIYREYLEDESLLHCHPANYSEVQSADCFMEISLSNNGTGTFELAVTAN